MEFHRADAAQGHHPGDSRLWCDWPQPGAPRPTPWASRCWRCVRARRRSRSKASKRRGISTTCSPAPITWCWPRRLTDATRHIVDSAVLASAKPGLHLINIARGGLLDQEALLEALDNGQHRPGIAGRHRAGTVAGRAPALRPSAGASVAPYLGDFQQQPPRDCRQLPGQSRALSQWSGAGESGERTARVLISVDLLSSPADQVEAHEERNPKPTKLMLINYL